MDAINEIVAGFWVLFASAFHTIRVNFFKSVYVLIALLLIVHYLVRRAKTSKKQKVAELVVAGAIIAASIAGFIYFQQKTLHAYEVFIPTMEPLDLKCNYYGALESELYHTTITDPTKWGMTSVFMPPVFAFMRLSMSAMGDSFAQYYRNYRICGMIAAALTVLMLIGYMLKRLGRRAVSDVVLLAFAIDTFLFLFCYFVTDIRIGNTNVFVGVLVAAQLALTLWNHRLSKFFQALVLVLAWWIKPNMVLVMWCLTVFSISRKEYAYLAGLVCGAVAPVVASLFAPNISLDTYIVYFTKVSRVIEQASLDHTSNLSIFSFASNPIISYKIALSLAALFILFYTIKLKGKDFVKFEIFCFFVTYIFWTRVWAYYFIPVALIAWINMVNRVCEGRQIYLELLLILALSFSLAVINIIGVNLALAANALVYLGWHIHSVRKQVATTYESVPQFLS